MNIELKEIIAAWHLPEAVWRMSSCSDSTVKRWSSSARECFFARPSREQLAIEYSGGQLLPAIRDGAEKIRNKVNLLSDSKRGKYDNNTQLPPTCIL